MSVARPKQSVAFWANQGCYALRTCRWITQQLKKWRPHLLTARCVPRRNPNGDGQRRQSGKTAGLFSVSLGIFEYFHIDILSMISGYVVVACL
jgi:hypothetical protein